jgi:vacuolar-type H+-ATPase subunit H
MEKHQNGNSEFVHEVELLRQSENEGASIIEKAKLDSEHIAAEGREKSVEIIAKASEKAVDEKNAVLAKGRSKIEADRKKSIAAAQKEAAQIAQKSVSRLDAQKILSDLLSRATE